MLQLSLFWALCMTLKDNDLQVLCRQPYNTWMPLLQWGEMHSLHRHPPSNQLGMLDPQGCLRPPFVLTGHCRPTLRNLGNVYPPLSYISSAASHNLTDPHCYILPPSNNSPLMHDAPTELADPSTICATNPDHPVWTGHLRLWLWCSSWHCAGSLQL